MIDLALVGAAHIHVPDYVKRISRRPECRVKYVWDHDPDRASRWAAELSTAVISEVAEVWRDPRVSAVVICSETYRHEALVLAAADAGKHLFVEKPLGMNSVDACRMARAIDGAGIIFQTGYFMRGQPGHLFLKEQVEQGHFGKITRIRHSNCHSGSLGGWFDGEWRWMADPRLAGVGAFGDLGTHSLDILMWLMGKVERVTADIGAATGRYADCDEYGEGLIHFSNGAVGTLAAGWVDVADPVRAVVSGTEGHALLTKDRLFFKSVHVPGAEGTEPWTDLPQPRPHAFEQFLDAVGGNTEVPLILPEEAAERSVVMEAMYTAARERRWAALQELE